MSKYGKLMAASAVVTIIAGVATVGGWLTGGKPESSADRNSNNTGVILGGGNSGTINNTLNATPPAAADLSNPSIIYINPEAGRQFRCTMNDGRCDRTTRDTTSPTLTLQFSNDGNGAATDVRVQVYAKGLGRSLDKRFDRIPTNTMTKSVFAVPSSRAPRVAACIEYADETGARKWVVFAGQSSDGSGGVMTGLANFADFQKVDDGRLTGTGSSCSDRAQSALTE